jgi:hypothetical protein
VRNRYLHIEHREGELYIYFDNTKPSHQEITMKSQGLECEVPIGFYYIDLKKLMPRPRKSVNKRGR